MALHQWLALTAVVAAFDGNPDAVSNAGLLCMLMDNTRSVAPCSVSEPSRTVTINIRLKGETADQVCARLQTALSAQQVFFDGAAWRLDITAAPDRNQVVASCDLPQRPKGRGNWQPREHIAPVACKSISLSVLAGGALPGTIFRLDVSHSLLLAPFTQQSALRALER